MKNPAKLILIAPPERADEARAFASDRSAELILPDSALAGARQAAAAGAAFVHIFSRPGLGRFGAVDALEAALWAGTVGIEPLLVHPDGDVEGA